MLAALAVKLAHSESKPQFLPRLTDCRASAKIANGPPEAVAKNGDLPPN